MKPSVPIVSDHAILRWMERVEGYDIEALRSAIARAGAVGIRYGAKSVVVGKGKLVITDDGAAVSTVLSRGQHRRDLMERIEVELVDVNIAAARRNGRKLRRR